MDWYHPALGLVAASDSFTLDDVQYPAGWLRNQQPEGFLPVVQAERPDDKLFLVGEQIVTISGGDAVVSWNATPRDPAHIKAAADREARTRILAQLDQIDRRRVRPLGAIVAAQAAGQPPHPLDLATLAALEDEAANLRAGLPA